MKVLLPLLVLFAVSSVAFSEDVAPPPSTASKAVLHVLGVAQDAGYPQINCYEPRCLPIWARPELASGASMLALVIDGSRFHLFDAAPTLPRRLYQFWTETGLTLSDLEGVWLTHAHMGHYAGLLYFGKEAASTHGVSVHAMPRMAAFLARNGPWSQLVSAQNIVVHQLTANTSVLIGAAKVTPWLVPHRDEFSETVGYLIEGPNRRALYLPDIDKWQKWDQDLVAILKTVDIALLDATFFSGDELPGRDINLIPHPTVLESMALLKSLPRSVRSRVVFTHMNHTNPLLDPGSKETQSVLALGFRIARVGNRFDL
ncbi:MAG: MBL fold metallo-hydrolase [Pseudomonadales bacterium]|nr:MBL fold metallo-hydrolase [Pseudomonadales bacterium]